MGVASSKATSDTKSTLESINEIISNTSQMCSSSSASAQIINISGIKAKGCALNIGGIKQTGSLENRMECFQSNSNKTDISNKINKKIDDKVDAVTKGGFGISLADSKSVTESANKLKNLIKTDYLAQCLSNTDAVQEFKALNNTFDCSAKDEAELDIIDKKLKPLEDLMISGVALNSAQQNLYDQWTNERKQISEREPIPITIGNIQQDLILKAVSKCVQNNEVFNKAMNDFDETITKSTSSTAEGYDPTNLIIAITVLIVVGVIGFAVFKKLIKS